MQLPYLPYDCQLCFFSLKRKDQIIHHHNQTLPINMEMDRFTEGVKRFANIIQLAALLEISPLEAE